MNAKKLPYGNINSIKALSSTIRARRKMLKLTQTELAGLCGLGTRFISDLENGKPTCEVGKILKVLELLGLEIQLIPRSWATIK